ncbi:unnamed protein product [Aureobasidium uvarum]|uniref:Calpain catalytic domain-containing protein n=1 Tax=Aureobasidium uvarum TaxID=2773716 RepID=A0A9N8KQP3_9PEZI|nr:unnamed protein product [Aureobasidium uvarum]
MAFKAVEHAMAAMKITNNLETQKFMRKKSEFFLDEAQRIKSVSDWKPQLDIDTQTLDSRQAKNPKLRLSAAQLEVFDDWKRASEALPPPAWYTPQERRAGPTMSSSRTIDLVQDAATDCSVVASLCALVARGERGHAKILGSMMYPYDMVQGRPKLSPNGKYTLKLNFNGTHRRVEIDDFLPVSRSSRVLHVIDRHNPSLLWPALIEKAYLKVRGSYDFPGSNSGTDLWILSKISTRTERAIGLAGEHDYAVLDMREVEGQKLMLVKNPWCEGMSWRGSIPRSPIDDEDDEDEEVLPSSRDLLNQDDKLTPGTFWMDLNSVMQYFESIYLNWNPGLFRYRQDIHFAWDLSASSSSSKYKSFSSNQQFCVSTAASSTAWLLLSRHFKDGKENVHPSEYISLYVFDNNGARVYLSDGAVQRGPFVDSLQTLVRLDNLEANKKYTIVPVEQDLGPTTHSFTLSVFANARITIGEAPNRYPCHKTITTAWTEETAGGNAHSPTYSQNPQFSIIVPVRTPIALLLETAMEQLHVHVKLVHGRGSRIQAVRSKDIVFDSKDYRRGCALAQYAELEAGTYTIICSTFEAGQKGNFKLRVDSMVATQLSMLPRQGAGRLRRAWAKAAFEGQQRTLAAPIAPRRLTKLDVFVKQVQQIGLQKTAKTGQSRERSMIRVTLEVGTGPERRILIASSNGEYSDSSAGVRTGEIDLSPQEMGKVWLVIERMFTPMDSQGEMFEIETFTDAPDTVDIGVWRSRFDIVWPDNATGPEPRAGVDALTYGLSTLVMAEEIFGNRRSQSMEQRVRRRRGNHFASFTKKFSLGNDLITKEGGSGKMLGTLVALAIARMRRLESFTWDMPTGVLSAVWDALSSLADHEDDQSCRLERVAVRWHDNYAEPHNAPIHIPRQEGVTPPSLSALRHVENPSFSILPPLKSLSVLDIDEVQYLDELSVLIDRSVDKLRELRIGIAHLAKAREFCYVWEGDNVQQVDRANPVMSCITMGEKRLGGILGILTGMIFDLRSIEHPLSNRLRRRSNVPIGPSQVSGTVSSTSTTSTMTSSYNLTNSGIATAIATNTPSEDSADEETITSVEHIQATPKTSTINPGAPGQLSATGELPQTTLPYRNKDPSNTQDAHSDVKKDDQSSALSRRLSLDVLELENIPLSIPVMLNTIDWSALTTLTLLRCFYHEHLWKALRRQFSPDPSPSKPKYHTGVVDSALQLSDRPSGSEKTFRLNLKHIYTDTVSSSLISFIKETLRPNSLESVFFLHNSIASRIVPLDAIFNGVIRRHRTSLRELLIDSGDRMQEDLPGANVVWRQWMFSRDIIKFLGKMPCLRELGAALDYRDWHFFLQHLPALSKLRSLYIPYIVNYSQGGSGSRMDTRELALQVVDVAALRPELEICYVGIMKKCFEIFEQKPGSQTTDHSGAGVDDDSGSEDEDDNDDEASADEDDDDGDDSNDTASDTTDHYEDSELGSSEHENDSPALRLREILYYDDKVSVFKARHGRL